MLKRTFDVIAVVLLLAGLAGAAGSYYFLYHQRFIEALVAGILAFVLLRGGLYILRLMVARRSLGEAHRRILGHLAEDESVPYRSTRPGNPGS